MSGGNCDSNGLYETGLQRFDDSGGKVVILALRPYRV